MTTTTTTAQFDTTERSLRREIRWDLFMVVLVVVGSLVGLGATNDAARTVLANSRASESPGLLSLGGPKRPPRPVPPIVKRTSEAAIVGDDALALGGPKRPPRPIPPIVKRTSEAAIAVDDALALGGPKRPPRPIPPIVKRTDLA